MITIIDITTLNLFDSKYHLNNYYSPNLNIVSNNIKQITHLTVTYYPQ